MDWATLSKAGSSPLARGKPRLSPRSPLGGRLIPARAGKTENFFVSATTETAHPRSRGENLRRLLHPLAQDGSSPLARGKQPTLFPIPGTPRLIPARAGKTSAHCFHLSVVWAHPRSRGENHSVLLGDSSCFGSSPLARGKLGIADAADDAARLIPARAGKTVGSDYAIRPFRAHPRSRGENVSNSSSAR